MNNSKLYFQVAIEDIKKKLDEQKQVIKDWSKATPVLLKVKVQSGLSELEDLKRKLKALGVTFGENNSQIKQLGNDIDQVASVFVSRTGKMSKAAQELSAAQSNMATIREEYLQTLNKETELQSAIVRNNKNIAEAQQRINVLTKEGPNKFKNNGSGLVPNSTIIAKYEKQVEVWRNQNRQYEEELARTANWKKRLEESYNAINGRSDELQRLTERTTSQQRYNNMLADTEKLLERIKNASNMPGSSSSLQVGMRDISAFLEKASSLAGYKDDSTIVTNLINEYNRLLKVYGSIATEQEKLSKANDAAAAKEARNAQAEIAARQRATQTIRTQAEALVNARRETLRSQATDLGKLLSLGEKGLGVEQYNHVRDALRAIRQELREIDTIMQRGGRSSGLLLSLGGNTRDYSHVINTAQQYANIRVQSEHDVTTAVQHSTSALSQQSQVLSDLKTMAQQYVSVWAAQSFINNIIEQGGQLEQQRLSIQAILGDAAQARTLFEQIKALAPQSPFGIIDLDKMSKQLTAYGFEYHELFDWTKRLADISAATGTEVSRLALALGHVRSEGALSGYTLRQFSMGNIPLLEKLSEKLGTTKKEIREMVKKKEIGFEDVVEVLKDLTDEGGMFYKAQETMAEALNAKYKNLRDTFAIMYGEMAEGAVGDVLKDIAETLTSLSRNWRVLLPMLTAGAAAMGVQKLATVALNHELVAQEKYIGRNAIATSKYSMSQLRAIATTGRWTLALRGLGRAMMSIGKFVFNPVTLGFAAVEGLIYLWQRHNQEMEKAEELTKQYALTGKEAAKNLKIQMDNIDPFSEGMSESKLRQGIDQMSESLKNYGINRSEIFKTAFGTDEETGKVKTLAEQYQYLSEQLEHTRKVYEEMQRTAGAFEFGIKHSDGGWLDDDVQTDLTNYADKMKEFYDEVSEYALRYGDVIENAVNAAVKADPAFAEATKNMDSYIQKLAVFWENPEKFAAAVEKMNTMFQGGNSDDALELNNSFIAYLSAKNEAKNEIDSFFEGVESWLKDRNVKINDLSKEQADALIKQLRDFIAKHPEWENIHKDIVSWINQRWPALKFSIEPGGEDIPNNLQDWQLQMKKWLEAHKLKVDIKPTTTREEIVKMVHDTMKDAQTAIDQTKPILLRFKADLSDLNNLPAGLQTPWGKKQAADYKTNSTTYNTAKDFLNEFGLPQPKEKGSGRKEDKALKDAKVRLDEAKAFLSEYKKYRQTYGKERSISILEELFPTTKGKGQKIVDDYKSLLGQIKNSLKLNTADRKKFSIDIDKLIAETDLSEAKEKIDRQLKSMEQYISDSVEKYDLYKSLFEKTGSKEFAMSAFSNGQIWDDAAKGLADILKEKMGEKGSQLDWEADKQNAEDWFKKNFTNGEELYKMWEKIVDLISKNYQQALTDGADAVSRQLTIAEKIRKVEAEIEDLRRKRSNATDDSTRASYDRQIFGKGNELSKLNSEAFKESLDYLRFFGASLNMANSEVQRIGTAIKAELSKELSNGTITAADYSRTLKEVNKRMEESRSAFKGDFMTFLTQGQKGLVEKQQSAVDDAAIKIAQAEKERQEAVIRGDKAGAAAAEARRKSAEKEKEDALKALGISSKQYETLNSMLATVNIVKGALDGMQKAAESLSEMLDALGHEGSANTWSDIADGIKAVSSALTPLNNVLQSAMSGNVSGLVSSAISAPVEMMAGPITALAQLHDKKRERQIEDLRRDVQKIDNTLNLIKSLRERTLGYDNGDLRRRLSAQYESQMKSINSGLGFKIDLNPAASAMKEYYSRGGLDGSGYKQELEALKKQRQDYQDMWDAENDKKKSSAEALEEYRLKMSELDEQIMFFVEDLSKELWGIDFKAWASQISDALWTAFENGEDAVKAFRDTAKDIISDVAKRMMNIHLIEPLFKDLEKDLFGKIDANGNRVGGVYNHETGQFDEQEALKILGKAFGEGGDFEKVIESAQSFYEMVGRITGIDFSSKDKSSSASSSIKGITEQTADLLCSYVNACRADLSVNRAMIAQYFPMFYNAMTSGNASLRNIENHTAAIMRSNDAIMSSNAEVRDILKRVTQGGDRVRVS